MNSLLRNIFLSFVKKQVINYMLWLGFQNIRLKANFRTIINAIFPSQLVCCPLIWMFHNRTLKNRINKLQQRALRLVHDDKTSSFYELLQKGNSFTIHHRNIQKLALEIYRVKHHIAPKVM